MSARYSLSSAMNPPSKPKKKRVSDLISFKSRKSSEELGRKVEEEPRSQIMTQAAAWVWHTRGIGEASVLPTKRNTGAHEMLMRCRSPRPMSRFKAEAMLLSPTTNQHCPKNLDHSSADRRTVNVKEYQASAAAAVDHLCAGEQQSPGSNSTSFFDDLELSRLQQLLEREQVSYCDHSPVVADHHVKYAHKPVKPPSTIHKLIKRLFTSARSQSIGAAQTVQYRVDTRMNDNMPISFSSAAIYPRNAARHHVIHYHHHYYHQLHESPQVHLQRLPVVSDHQLVRRRRHSESSYNNQFGSTQCNEIPVNVSDVVGLEIADSIYVAPLTANAHRPHRRFSAEGFDILPAARADIDSADNVDADADADQGVELQLAGETPTAILAGRQKLASTVHYSRPRRHSYASPSLL